MKCLKIRYLHQIIPVNKGDGIMPIFIENLICQFAFHSFLIEARTVYIVISVKRLLSKFSSQFFLIFFEGVIPKRKTFVRNLK